MQLHGKLIVVEGGEAEKEYLLAQDVITLGRGYDNDVTLSDPKASRYHAEITHSDGQYEVRDLDSTNGTWLEDERIQRSRLHDGSTLRIGGTELRLEIATADTLSAIGEESGTMEITLAKVSVPRLVIHATDATREVLLESRLVTIGRGADNDVVLDDAKVSRRHAQIEQEGREYVVADLGSTNGVWVQGQRVQQKRLADNDTIKIGDAKIFFKAGLRAAYQSPPEKQEPPQEEPRPARQRKRPERYPIVFVPGFMGSELYRGDEKVWPNLSRFMSEGHTMMFSNRDLEPRGVVDEVVIVPGLVKLDTYGGFIDFLVENLGYRRGKDLLEFGYDFRQDNRLSAEALRNAIQEWQQTIGNLPIIIVAHSLGGIVSRYYIQRLGGKDQVRRLITMGTPHYGTPKTLLGLVSGVSPFPMGLKGKWSRKILLTYPSTYQTIPTYPVVYDDRGQAVDMYQDESWLPERYRPLLRDGKQFGEELGNECSVPTMCVFGYGHSTLTKMIVSGRGNQRWSGNIEYEYAEEGDGTVPTRSAILEGVEVHPVRQAHGALYSDKDVRMRLQYELLEGLDA